jgi:hypothetical protein
MTPAAASGDIPERWRRGAPVSSSTTFSCEIVHSPASAHWLGSLENPAKWRTSGLPLGLFREERVDLLGEVGDLFG